MTTIFLVYFHVDELIIYNELFLFIHEFGGGDLTPRKVSDSRLPTRGPFYAIMT